MFIALAMIFAVSISLFINLKSSSVSASAEEGNPPEIVYYDTEVINVVYRQDPTNVFFGFELSNSDYDEKYEGFFGTSNYPKYSAYIREQLNYFTNFPQMNSAGATFDHNEAWSYWNGKAVGEKFKNTVAHRSDLALLEYGFYIYFPAGTTFPSYDYAKGGFVGAPVMYRTTEDKAFYFDGSGFVNLAVSVVGKRAEAFASIGSVDYSLYLEGEHAKLDEIISSYQKKLNACVNLFSIEDVLAEYHTAISEVMTKADYEELALVKTSAKADLTTFFDGISESAYDETEWAKILSIKDESDALIDSLKSISDVTSTVTGIKYAVGSVLSKEQKTAFAEYRASAIARLTSSFDATLYSDEVRAQVEAILSEGKQAIEKATSHAEVDALEGSYISKISSLEQKEEAPVEPENNENNLIWIFVIIGGCVLVAGIAVTVVVIIIKKKRKGKENEEN